jgi:hypothetical protein
LIAIFDGKEVQIREGEISGKISKTLRGTNGFGWDDMFIPDGQPKESQKTFAEMVSEEKDKYSMRRIALEKLKENPFEINYPVYQIPEPFAQELERVRKDRLNKDERAVKFAFSLETLNGITTPNGNFLADKYVSIKKEDKKFFSRFIGELESPSLGLLLTDVDRSNLKLYENGNPVIWQMGPERRFLALAQRAEFFLENQNETIHKVLEEIAAKSITPRSNRRSEAVEEALGIKANGKVTIARALKEVGYKKISASKNVSRTKNASLGLFSKIGKYPRSIYGIGSMPPVSGWRDVLVTAAIANMPIFTHRNSLNAIDPSRQIRLIKEAKEVIRSLGLTKKLSNQLELNIGAAIGAGNPKEELERVKKLYDEANVKMFRLYTISGDPRTIEIPRLLRQEFGDEIELFIGQVSDKKQALRLIEDDIKADALVFGHGGGRQCTSATNGMAVTTLEEIYNVTSDKRFNNTTIVAEGGVGTSVGGLLILGVDLILYNQQLTAGSIEVSDIFFQNKNGKLCHPYHGSASAPTMIIESENSELLEKRMELSGRARNVEGKPGYQYFSEKVNSMTFLINQFRHYAARTLADFGVESIDELRKFLLNNDDEYLRVVTTEASAVGQAYRS